MRLVFASREYRAVSPESGGIGAQYATICPALARLGHDVVVLTLAEDAGGVIRQDGVEIHRLPHRRLSVLDPLGRAAEVARALDRLPAPDVVIAPEFGGEAVLARTRKRPFALVTHLHSSLIQGLRSEPRITLVNRVGPLAILQRTIERRQAVRSDAILACSETVLEWTRRLWPIGEIPARIVPNAVDVARIRALAERPPPEELPTGDGSLVLFTGRLEPLKGPQVLVDAMRDVWTRVPDARLVLVGADSTGMTRDLVAAAGPFADRLHLLGRQPPERLFPALAAADVAAFPSFWEAFGIGALEALTLGRPTVLTSGSGYEDFAVDGHNALVVPPRDAPSLGRAITRLLEDAALRERLGREAARLAEGFDAAPVAERYAAALMA